MNKPEYLRIFLTLFVIYSLIGIVASEVKASEINDNSLIDSMNLNATAVWSDGEYGLSDDVTFENVDYPEYLEYGEDINIDCLVEWKTDWSDVLRLDFYMVLKLMKYNGSGWFQTDIRSEKWIHGEYDTDITGSLDGGAMGYYTVYFQIEINKRSIKDYNTMELYGGKIEGEKGVGSVPSYMHTSSNKGSFTNNLWALVNPVEYHKLITDGMPGWLYGITSIILAVWILAMLAIVAEFIRSNVPLMG